MTIKHLVHNAQTSKSGLDTTSWCRKSLFDQSFQSNSVIKWFQFNFQIFECITNHFGQLLFGIEQIPSMVHIKNHPPSLLNFFIWVNANGLLLLLRKKDAHGRVAKCPMCIFDASGFYSSTGIECSNGSSLEKRGLRLAIHESESYWDL